MGEVCIEREFGAESAARITHVAQLKPGARVHVSGVAGTGMAAVLALLKKQGFYVSGSDKAFYPPMGEVVKNLADRIYQGYSEENIQDCPELVVIGNNLSKDNPEVRAVLERGLRYASMPEVFAARLIGSREQCRNSVVVAGTHGKTTTSAIIASMLASAGREPGYFIGGVPTSLPTALELPGSSITAAKRVVVLEGDEYDSAFFAKFSKFHCYRPDIAVITSLEFDHADIYQSLSQIEREFTLFVRRVPADGVIYVCDQGADLQKLISTWCQDPLIVAPIVSYGLAANSAFKILKRSPATASNKLGVSSSSPSGQCLEFALKGSTIKVNTPLSGEHNALNLLVSAAVGEYLELEPAAISVGLEVFTPVLRRQQILLDRGGVLLMEDFAHHPTAVRTTLEGLRESYPERRIIAVFEPRSNTSRRAFFQQAYAESFDAADLALIFDFGQVAVWSGVADNSRSADLMDISTLVVDISARGTEAYAIAEIEQLANRVSELVLVGDLIVLMSNGDFGGLAQLLISKL